MTIITTTTTAAIIANPDAYIKLTTTKGHELWVPKALNDAGLAALLTEALAARWSSFGDSMLGDYHNYNNFTPKQRPWVAKLIHDASDAGTAAAKVEHASKPVLGGADRLMAMFDKAGEAIKWPKIRINLNGLTIKLSRAGSNARHPGSINVVLNADDWAGRVHTDGTLDLYAARCEQAGTSADAVTSTIAEWLANPEDGARLFGQLTGACCFCNRELTTGESLTAGYGPVCADRFGLSWGHVDENLMADELAGAVATTAALPGENWHPASSFNIEDDDLPF